MYTGIKDNHPLPVVAEYLTVHRLCVYWDNRQPTSASGGRISNCTQVVITSTVVVLRDRHHVELKVIIPCSHLVGESNVQPGIGSDLYYI